MTEDEAKTKWCPFARARAFGSEASVNRPFPGDGDDDIPHAECLCIASACMAWRPIPARSLDRAREEAAANRKINAIKALREVFPDMGLLEGKNIVEGTLPWPAEPNGGGYCGLVGAPQ